MSDCGVSGRKNTTIVNVRGKMSATIGNILYVTNVPSKYDTSMPILKQS